METQIPIMEMGKYREATELETEKYHNEGVSNAYDVAKQEMKEVSLEHYEDMLCVLPPKRREGTFFLVWEPSDHKWLYSKWWEVYEWLPRYAMFGKIGGKYYDMWLYTEIEFDEKVQAHKQVA